MAKGRGHGRYGVRWASFWDWAKARKLSDAAIVLTDFIGSSRHSGACGAARLPLAYITEDLDWPEEKARATIREVLRTGYAINPAPNWYVLRDYFQRHQPTNAKHAAGMVAAMAELPRAVRSAVASRALAIPEAKAEFERWGTCAKAIAEMIEPIDSLSTGHDDTWKGYADQHPDPDPDKQPQLEQSDARAIPGPQTRPDPAPTPLPLDDVLPTHAEVAEDAARRVVREARADLERDVAAVLAAHQRAGGVAFGAASERDWIAERLGERGLAACLRAAEASRDPGRRSRTWTKVLSVYGSPDALVEALAVVDAAIAARAEWLPEELRPTRPHVPHSTRAKCATCGKPEPCACARAAAQAPLTPEARAELARLGVELPPEAP